MGVKKPERRADTVIRRALAPLAGATLVSTGDGQLAVHLAGQQSAVLETRWVGEGWPGDVQALLARTPKPWPRQLVAAARDFSTGAVAALTQAGANYADEQGRAHLIVPPGLLVDRQAVSASKPRRHDWSRSSEAVGEWLLARALAGGSTVDARTVDLANATGWSPGQVSNVLQFFDRRGWTRREGTERGVKAKRVLADVPGLLDAWSGHVASTPRRARLAHALVDEPVHWVTTVLAPSLAGTRWGLSGLTAAELLQPTMIGMPGVVHCYLPDDDFDQAVEHACQAAGLRPVDSGERVVIWAAPTWVWDNLGHDSDTGVPLVSVARVHADLIRVGGRGLDAASVLRERFFEYR
jgi:hypothetical protein